MSNKKALQGIEKLSKYNKNNTINSSNSKVIDYALKIANCNIPCFPCNLDKSPACNGGFKSATTNIDKLEQLFNNSNAKLIGVPTGERSGLDTLDIDPKNGGDKWFETNKNKLSNYRTHKTISGGYHIIFNHKQALRNSASKIAQGVDVRANGGYIIWWPAYDLETFYNNNIFDWPEWILDSLKPKGIIKNRLSYEPIKHSNEYLDSVLRSAYLNILHSPEGSRNNTLNSEAFSLSRFIECRELTHEDVISTLAKASFSAGLNQVEIYKTIQSAFNARGV